LPFFQKFKQRNPTQTVFLHYNGNARDPLDGSVFTRDKKTFPALLPQWPFISILFQNYPDFLE
jgi:hypothetical protein